MSLAPPAWGRQLALAAQFVEVIAIETQSVAPNGAQFGSPVGQYRAGVLVPILAITGILSLAGSAFFTWVIFQGITNPDLHQKYPQSGFILVAGFLAGAVYAFWQWYVWRGIRVDLFERGMTLSNRGKSRAIAWNEIATVAAAASQWSNNVFRIDLLNGETVYLSWAVGKVFRLGDTIQQMSAPALLPRAIASWQSGDNVPFGPIHVLQTGLQDGIRYQTLLWNDVGHVTLSGLTVAITRKDRTRWAAFSKYGVPNVYVFISLVEHILAAKP